MEVWGMTSVSAGAHNRETRECVEEEVLVVDARTVWIDCVSCNLHVPRLASAMSGACGSFGRRRELPRDIAIRHGPASLGINTSSTGCEVKPKDIVSRNPSTKSTW